MLNQTILLKVKERLNKLDSSDYDNLEPWQIVEAFNKGQVDWTRRNLHGLNSLREGDEQSTSKIDDFQVLLDTIPALLVNKQQYMELDVPADYLRWKRISSLASSSCCPDPKPMVIYLAEEANVNVLLRDKAKQPSFEWGETFATIEGDFIKIWTGGTFTLLTADFTYYKQPTRIQIAGVPDPYDPNAPIPTVDIISVFKDDIVEVLIDECAKILAGDIESQLQMQRETQSVESNT
jgi:hypothetical protein